MKNESPIEQIIVSIIVGVLISLVTGLFFAEFEVILSIIIMIVSIIVSVLVVRKVGRYRSVRVTLVITHTISYPIIAFVLQQIIMTWLENITGINPS